MALEANPELLALKKSLIEGMTGYMSEGDISYDQSHIDECKSILETHLVDFAKAGDKGVAMECVRQTVLKLNDLNTRAGDELIETDQREDICQFIIKAGALRGFNAEDEDITEDWREW